MERTRRSAAVLLSFRPAQDKGYWRAVSSNANDITGDLTISDSKLAINFASFPLAQIRKLQPAEWSAIFDADPGLAAVISTG